MTRNFDRIYERRNTNCFKWDKNIEIYGKEDVISLWVADMDLPVCPIIEQAIIDRAKHPVYGYTFRDKDYYQAFIDWQFTRNKWSIDPEWVINSTSVVISINLIIRALTLPDDDILIFSPVYSQFAVTINDTKRNIINSPLINDGNQFRIDFDDLENKLAAGVKLLIFCSPHNPVGRVWSKPELIRLADLCLKYNTIIISDEIHSDLIYSESKHLPLASIAPEVSQITISCMSPGKTFNISGLAVGFIIIENPLLRKKISKIFMNHHLMAANIFGITACKTAYKHCQSWLDDAIRYLQQNRDYLIDYCEKKLPLIQVYKPEGTYLAWLDFSKFQLCQNHLQAFLVHIAHLGLDNGTKFGIEGEGFMRFNFACSRNLLKKALDNLDRATQKLVAADFDLSKIADNIKFVEDCD